MRVSMQNRDRLIAWAEPIMGVDPGRMPPETLALGVIDDNEAIRAVICFNAFYSTHASAHIASDGSRNWSTRHIWRVIFAFAFDHLALTRINLVIPQANISAVTFALKLGFQIEGVARYGANDGTNGILFGMLAQECRWLSQRVKDRINGKIECAEA